MKNINITSLLVSILFINTLKAQDINPRNVKDSSHHLISAYFGADYSSYYGISYGHKILTKSTPIIVGAEYTMPFGNEIFDDFKFKLSAQGELWHNQTLSFSVKPAFIIRKYESPLAKLYDIGGDITCTFGLAKSKWSIVSFVNYDKSFSTYIKHDLLKEYYPEIKDGWFGSTGGNFKFGARASYSAKALSLYITAGKAYGQDFNANPTLPFFADFNVQVQF